MSRALFPQTVRQIGTSFPPQGPAGRFPCFVGTMRCSETPSSIPLRFVVLGSAVPSEDGDDGASQVPGKPSRACCALRDPGGTPNASTMAAIQHVAFRDSDNVGSHDLTDFGAQSHSPLVRCLRFAVQVTRHHARLASDWLPRPWSGGTSPAGFHRKVSACHVIPFPRLGLAHRSCSRGCERSEHRRSRLGLDGSEQTDKMNSARASQP